MSASIAFILFAAAITPGPNNLVVVDVARRGLHAAVPPIAGIVLGTLAVVLGLRFGLGATLAAHPTADHIMRIAGVCVLGYLSIRTFAFCWSKPSTSTEEISARRALFFALLSFQIVNPKTWVLASAVSTTHAALDEVSILSLVLPTIFVPACCLFVWGMMGQVLGRFFQDPIINKSFSFALALTYGILALLLVLND